MLNRLWAWLITEEGWMIPVALVLIVVGFLLLVVL